MCDLPVARWYMWLVHVSLVRVCYDSLLSVTWLIHTRDMTHSYTWHDVFIYVTWLIRICDVTCLQIKELEQMGYPPRSYLWHDSFLYVTWLMHVFDMTNSYVCHDSFTRSYMWFDSFIFVKWHIHTRDMTYSYTWHDSFIYVTNTFIFIDVIDTFIYMTWLIHKRGMTHSQAWLTHSCMWHDSFTGRGARAYGYPCHASCLVTNFQKSAP